MRPLLITTALLLIVGCGPKRSFFPYSSTADVPSRTEAITTELKFMSPDSDKIAYPLFGVFYAADSGGMQYLLAAPSRQPWSDEYVGPFEIYDLDRGVPLTREKAREFVRVLDACLDVWDDSPSMENAVYIEYTLTPESDVHPKSATVDTLKPALWYQFQHSESGVEAHCRLGKQPLATHISYRKKAYLERLRRNLERALEQFGDDEEPVGAK